MSHTSPPAFPVRLMVKWNGTDWKEWHWRTICVVYDSESLGFLERLLRVELRTEPA